MNGHINPTFISDNIHTENGKPLKKFSEIDISIDTKNQSENVEEANKNTNEAPPARENWGNSIEFLMSCIASSVGLGNVWRFPFTALENGGGAFLIPYICVLLFVGRPLYYLEMIIGQFSSRGSVKVYDLSPAMRGVGYGQVLAVGIIATYYASLMGLTVRYLFASFTSILPWSECKDTWVNCVSASDTFDNETLKYVYNNNTKTSSELYFINEILQEKDSIDDGIGVPDWRLVLCLGFCWLAILGILIKGVRSSGKFSYFLALFPYVIMFILFARAVTLPGSLNGIIYFIKPQWDQLLNPKVWYAAVTQCFFSLTVCLGNIIMYSSYNKFSHNVYRDVNIVTSIDTLTSLLAGFTIFGILGNLAHELDIDDISSVVKGGTGLAFISYPDAISKFTWAPQLFAVLFFLMLFVLGLGSNVAVISSIQTVIRDSFPQVKHYQASLFIGAIGLGVGVLYVTPGGQFILNLVDFYSSSFIVFILAMVELVALSWLYGVDRLCKDIEFMLNRKTGLYWRLCWGFITPMLMFVILIYSLITMEPLKYKDVFYPDSAYAAGGCLVALGLIQLPIWMIYAILKESRSNKEMSLMDAIVKSFQPTKDWGPTDPILLEQYRKYVENEINPPSLVKVTIWQKIKKNLLGK